MNLDWDKKVIEECKNRLQNKIGITEEEILLVDFYADYLNNSSEEKEEDEIKIIKQKEIINILKEEISNYKKLLSELPKKNQINLLTLIEGLGKKCVNEKERFLLEIKDKTSNKELVSLSYEIYNDVSNDFNDELNYIYKNNLVKVDRTNKVDGPVCFCDIYNKKGFVFIPYYSDSSLISCFNHELAHSIITNLNGDFYIDKNFDFSEFHSIFMENYTDMYMYNKTNNKIFLYSEYDSLDRFKDDIRDLAIISSLSDIKKLTKQEIIKKMSDDFGIDLSKNFNKFFSDFVNGLDIYSSYLYIFGACCSINLLNKDDLDEIKNRFTKTCFNNITRRRDFFNLIGFYINNEYYLYDILDKEFKQKNKLIRKIK